MTDTPDAKRYINDVDRWAWISPAHLEKVIVTSGSDTYIATALPGTSRKTAEWIVKKISVSGSTTVIRYANNLNEPVHRADSMTSYSYPDPVN